MFSLFVWLIRHQLAVLFSQNKPVTSNQPTIFFSHNKSAPVINHQPNEKVGCGLVLEICYIVASLSTVIATVCSSESVPTPMPKV
jgi:hypothetical protein